MSLDVVSFSTYYYTICALKRRHHWLHLQVELPVEPCRQLINCAPQNQEWSIASYFKPIENYILLSPFFYVISLNYFCTLLFRYQETNSRARYYCFVLARAWFLISKRKKINCQTGNDWTTNWQILGDIKINSFFKSTYIFKPHGTA